MCVLSKSVFYFALLLITIMYLQRTSLALILLSGIILSGCFTLKTRTEKDTFTITKEDTTRNSRVQNQPGTRDNGVIFPSARVTQIERTFTQYDSVETRDYPAFIRLGVFESVGLIGTAPSGKGIGTGLFGIYYDPADLFSDKINPKSDKVFGGGLYRFGIAEYRLRWFRDAANWTIGTSLFEMIYPSATNDSSLMSALPLYIRKRYYLREEIPYVCVTPSVGLGFYPSQYAHVSASLDVGSIGGLNMRAYLGYIFGMNAPNSALNGGKTTSVVSTPYFGIGISVLDFLNRVPELSREWKDHEHSSWDIGLMRCMIMMTGQDSSFFGSKFPLQGFQLLLAPTSIAIPLWNNRLYAGTELFNLVVAGGARQRIGFRTVETVAIGLGILPLRVGYWQPVLQDELSLEPFLEYSYFPHSMFQIGGRLNLAISSEINVSLNTGYISSAGFDTSNNFFTDTFGNGIGAFDTFYFGLSFGIQDRIFRGEELRYNREANR